MFIFRKKLVKTFYKMRYDNIYTSFTQITKSFSTDGKCFKTAKNVLYFRKKKNKLVNKFIKSVSHI